MNHKEVLSGAVSLLKQRGDQYGQAEQCFSRISAIASEILKKKISKHDVAMIHVATKLARMAESPQLADSYMDAINYMAFAAEFAKAEVSTGANVEEEIAAMARRLAPMRTENTHEKVHDLRNSNIVSDKLNQQSGKSG
jgi:hypothetical protein